LATTWVFTGTTGALVGVDDTVTGPPVVVVGNALVDVEPTAMRVVEGRVGVGDEVELIQAASVSATTNTPIEPNLGTVLIVSPIVGQAAPSHALAETAHGCMPSGTGMSGNGWRVQVLPPSSVVHSAADPPESQPAVPPTTQFWASGHDNTSSDESGPARRTVVQLVPPFVVLMTEYPVVPKHS
jgi:hypothetical protein